jgi:hypothetical protein
MKKGEAVVLRGTDRKVVGSGKLVKRLYSGSQDETWMVRLASRRGEQRVRCVKWKFEK